MKKGVFKVLFFFVMTIFFSVSGYINVKYGKNNFIDVTVNYSEKSSIDYKVYLKENDFFEVKYLEKNKTYIASLIDYVDVDFDYYIYFDEPLTGEYDYYIKGVINANQANNGNGNYLSKEVVLSDTTTKGFVNEKSLNVKQSVRIDYEKYNKILQEFKTKYAINIDGEMIVSLEIVNRLTGEKLTRDITKVSSVPLSIPLTSQTIEIPITSNDLSNKGILLSDKVESDDLVYFISKAVGYVFFVISAIFIYLLIKYGVLRAKVVSEYHKKLKKILKVYDGILVNVESSPKVSKEKTINVKSFDELIDAHSEVRRPINFSENKRGATFTLLNEGNAWVYFLKRESFFDEE